MLVTTKLGDSIISVIYYSLPFEICLFHLPAVLSRAPTQTTEFLAHYLYTC